MILQRLVLLGHHNGLAFTCFWLQQKIQFVYKHTEQPYILNEVDREYKALVMITLYTELGTRLTTISAIGASFHANSVLDCFYPRKLRKNVY